ncbi:carboxymuconolactone decarboxylase family protein [Exilibacterium tricleocarpae]|uniref:Carboxymuconolactone decarboxylase family protein n=1 Tax=Exilibacterium tricleocarpae TaxID=2591008 RepID=A0A545U9N5_9GAMM|nr:carboxymuconolactone decarboxylase family protein [Exilibacterium tricleocarpae]TQV86185.1 carboxymuconolactone decarboxylase family protein [Exilibacterium tricleocarpae]
MNRVNIQKIQPAAYKALLELEGYLADSRLPALLRELIRLRASQINGCSLCQGMHTEGAKKLGATDEQLVALPHWRSTDLFDEKEKAVLAVTEAVTLIADEGLPDPLYREVRKFLKAEEIAQLIVLIATINAWNRIGVATAA